MIRAGRADGPVVTERRRSMVMRWKPCVLAILLQFAGPVAPLGAQTAAGTVAGSVVSGRTRQPIAGVQVQIEGTDLAAITDARGQFTFTDVAADSVRLRFTMLGHRSVTQEVRVGAEDIRVVLDESAITLDEVVVTGTAGGTERRALGNAVEAVDVAELARIAPPPDLQTLLAGRLSGVNIMKSTGNVGAGGVTRVRGISSISLVNEPLIYVDGVRVDNDASSPSAAFRFGGDRPSRINDFNPEDIERIEVIKGPAAATLYGTEASNGVIQIFTKRGNVGPPAIDVVLKQGAAFLRDPIGLYNPSYYRDENGEVQSYHVLENDLRDGFGSPFSTGHIQGYGISVNGGSDAVRYYGSADYDREEGILSYNWQNRLSARANLTYSASPGLEITANLGATRSRVRSANAVQAMTVSIAWADPTTLGTERRGYRGAIPEWRERVEGIEEVDRTSASFTITNRPASWFTHRVTVGSDVGNIRGSVLFPRDPLGAAGPFGVDSEGFKEVRGDRNVITTVDYGATLDVGLNSSLSSASSAGVQYNQRVGQTHTSTGQTFPVPSIETVSGAGITTAGESFTDSKTFGVYLQQQFGWKDRLFITGAVRGDDHSAFGTNFDFVVYPKFSGTWVVSEEEFFGVDAVNTLRLRAAWGRAGQQPSTFAASRLYEPTTRNGAPTLTPGNAGNPDLRPEVGEELELGFDISLLDERISVEYTQYWQRRRDAILERQVPPSSGFGGTEFVNLGETRGWGSELSVRAQLMRRANSSLDLAFNLSTNGNEIVDLGGVVPGVFGPFASQRHVEGFPIGGIYGLKVLSAELDADGNVVNALCEGGDPVTGGGPPVPCEEAGLAYWGQPVPTWQGSVTTTLTLGRSLSISAMVDFLGGHQWLDGDAAGSHTFFNNSLAAVLRNEPILEAYRVYVPGSKWHPSMVDGGFAKLRNVSVAYSLPSTLTQWIGASGASVTVAGQNLAKVWQASKETFGMRHIDQEMRGNTAGGLSPYIQDGIPPYTRILMTLRVSL